MIGIMIFGAAGFYFGGFWGGVVGAVIGLLIEFAWDRP